MLKYILLIALILLISCESKVCDNCKGIGKIPTEYEVETPYEILQSDWKQNSFLNFFKSEEKHELVIELKNKSDVDGKFIVKASALFENLDDTKELTKTETVPAGDSKEFNFEFKINKKPKDFEFKVVAPKIKKKEEINCDICSGSGKLK